MIEKYHIGLEWIGEIDAQDLAFLCKIIDRSFEGELPTFTIQKNQLCVVLDKHRSGEWRSSISRYFDALVQLGLIRSWKLMEVDR